VDLASAAEFATRIAASVVTRFGARPAGACPAGASR
jgi:sugar/nucleoside kinase (ribokinase family)